MASEKFNSQSFPFASVALYSTCPAPIGCISLYILIEKSFLRFAAHRAAATRRDKRNDETKTHHPVCGRQRTVSFPSQDHAGRPRGYRVASFSKAGEALERFRQGGIDLVVTDMAMPGLDGPQLIATIKDLSPQTPAILISGKARVYNHESQADVFLAKGMYAPADLLERIRLLLVKKRGPKRFHNRPLAAQRIGIA